MKNWDNSTNKPLRAGAIPLYFHASFMNGFGDPPQLSGDEAQEKEIDHGSREIDSGGD